MTLVQTGFLNAIAVAIRILSSIVLNKILAIYVGPSGYAIIGQFQNLVTMLTTFANGATNTGVTKGTAEHFDDPDRQVRLWRTAGTITIVGSAVVGLGLALFSRSLAQMLLGDENLASVLIWLGVSLVFIALNGLLLAILNGKKAIKLFVMITIAGSLIGLGMTGALTVAFGLEGALTALSVNQAIVFLVTAVACLREPWFRPSMLVGAIDRDALRELLKFTAMALTSAIMVPLTQLFIRDHLIDDFGLASAGYWDALTRISALYLMVVTVPLSIYYLPRLAEIRDMGELKREIFSGYKLIVPVTILGAVTIYLLRDVIILILFTPDFAPMRDLFAWQTVGDLLKISSWLLGYILIARGMMKPFIATEILFGFSWYILVRLLTPYFGLGGAQIAYAINYLLYIVALSFILHNFLKRQAEHENNAFRGV